MNSSPTRAMLEGVVFSEHPERYRSRYDAVDPPTPGIQLERLQRISGKQQAGPARYDHYSSESWGRSEQADQQHDAGGYGETAPAGPNQ